MQQVQHYTPLNPNLELIRYDAITTIADSVNPLYYTLSPLDFSATKINNELLYSLDEDVGRALFSVLKRLSRYIRIAANAYEPGLTPGTLPLTIPIRLFQEVDMPYPTVLYIDAYQGSNPLFMLTTATKLRTMYKGLQKVGQEAVQWIETANLRARQLGNTTG